MQKVIIIERILIMNLNKIMCCLKYEMNAQKLTIQNNNNSTTYRHERIEMNALASSQPQLLYTRMNFTCDSFAESCSPLLLKLNTEHKIMRENYFIFY